MPANPIRTLPKAGAKDHFGRWQKNSLLPISFEPVSLQNRVS
jgi:hypothetical protein